MLGNGQLGRMLRQAGEPLGIAVWLVGLEADPEAVPFQQSVITAEIERWPETAPHPRAGPPPGVRQPRCLPDYRRPPDAKAAV